MNTCASRSLVLDGGLRSLENNGLRPLFTLAAPPMPPPRRAFCENEARPFTLIPGGLGAEQKTQSIGRSPIDCESFLRAPIVNKAQRSERPTRAERGTNSATPFKLIRQQITACRFTPAACHTLAPEKHPSGKNESTIPMLSHTEMKARNGR
jgi:hypothetical protein